MPVDRSMQASQKGGAAPCVGSVKVAPVGDAILDGDQDFDGSGKGGTQWEGKDFYDSKSLTFRKINNADPSAKNG